MGKAARRTTTQGEADFQLAWRVDRCRLRFAGLQRGAGAKAKQGTGEQDAPAFCGEGGDDLSGHGEVRGEWQAAIFPCSPEGYGIRL